MFSQGQKKFHSLCGDTVLQCDPHHENFIKQTSMLNYDDN